MEKDTGLKDIYESLRKLVDSLGKLVEDGETDKENTEEINTEEVEEIKTEEESEL